MLLRDVLTLLATAQVVTADSSHPVHFRKVNASTARSISAYKNLTLHGDGTLVNEQGFWFSHFSVGASRNLEMLINTGSSDAILNPGVYDPSSASRDQKRDFHISYATAKPDGSGKLSASGKVYLDVVTQLGANLTVLQQGIGLIDKPKKTPTFPHDGIIGFAGERGASLREKPFILSLCATHALSACRFGLSLRTNGTGQLHYGTVATDEFAGALTTVKTARGRLWSVKGDVTVNRDRIYIGLPLVTDSGTTAIFGPSSLVRKVFQAARIKEVKTENGYEGRFNCSDAPTIGFRIGRKIFNIDPKALAFKKDGDNCTASLFGMHKKFGDRWILGQAFFQGRYIDHNAENKTMGFANLKE
ncbi:aspartyl protease [Cordyceps militaris]|uniref:Aspartyl protease n=1 Tax=Cordyceps militaris TaxID=73501 RepID=A0A2H4S9V9_CORMI|nr:aspartyl protease [Cordyceps militaris]